MNQKTFTSADEKEILAQGELINTTLLSLYLQEQKINNTPLCAFDYIRTSLNGEPDMEYMETRLTAFLKLHPDTHLYITQGSICKNAYGETDHLRHEGSDYTASLIGAAIHAEEIQLWTNRSGMHNNDPQVVEGTKTVKNLSFEEAERLAYFDSKSLPLYCITPARENNIPVRLLNSRNPSASGTLISDRQDDSIIKAVATKDAVMYLKFESNNTLRPYLFISKIFEIFAKYRTSLCLLTSSNIDVSVAVDNKDFLTSIIRELNRYAKVLVEDRMSIVSVIGNMKWQYPGFESRIIEALKTVPLRMISYGSNNNDISLVIKATDKKRALQSLNDQLFQSVQ